MKSRTTVPLSLLVVGLLFGAANAQQYTRSGQLSQDWHCALAGVGAALVECKAIPVVGQKHYITGVTVQTTTATAAAWKIQSGTATACASNTTDVFPKVASTTWIAPVVSLPPQHISFETPIQITVNHAICVLGVVTNTINIQVSGFTTF